MSFLRTLLRPDVEEAPDKALVAHAANLVQLGEFQFLQLAYREWHGEELPEAMIDPLFRRYMLQDRAPAWARHYARRIAELDRQGRLDDRAPRFRRLDGDYGTSAPRGLRRFVLAASVVAAALAGGIVVGDLAAGKSSSILPPYFDENELTPAGTPPGGAARLR